MNLQLNEQETKLLKEFLSKEIEQGGNKYTKVLLKLESKLIEEVQKYFGVYDLQLKRFKHVGINKKDLTDYYAESLKEQFILDNDQENDEDNIKKLEELSSSQVLEMYGYEVIGITESDFHIELMNDFNNGIIEGLEGEQ